ncbi:AAA family ATPase [Oxalobacteraceae bacterium OM1]|nr:AAA family ATPase [Oxalobacteraceae bacterium OM1]
MHAPEGTERLEDDAADGTQGGGAQSALWPVPPRAQRHRYLEVVKREDVEAAAIRLGRPLSDRDHRTAAMAIIEHLRKVGGWRELPQVPADWRIRLDLLEQAYPNFRDYIAFLRTTYAIAEREGKSPHPEPVFLLGEPGIGKSLIMQDVARLLLSGTLSPSSSSSFTAPLTLRMEVAQASGDLVGVSDFWGNSKPGLLFERLIMGPYASPIVVLEELSRCAGSREYEPISPLYSLLDPESARMFSDLAHPWLIMDASAVIFIACGNDDTLPAAIRSRMKVIEVPNPTREQCRTIARELWRRLCRELPQATASLVLTDDALDVLSTAAPRVMRKALREAVGRVVYECRTQIGADDIRACGLEALSTSRRIGFV